jgi:hypothetical protein
MVATVNVEELNGGTAGNPVATVITSGRYCTRDSYAPQDNDPCVVPTSGSNYSYWKSHRIAWTGIGTKISNIRWYTSGNIKTNWTPGTGGKLLVGTKLAGDNGCPDASYAVAVGTPGETGYFLDDASTGHGYYKVGSTGYQASVDADTYVSATPLTVDTTQYSTNTHSFHVVTQVKLTTSAVQGDKPSETCTFRYDEI